MYGGWVGLWYDGKSCELVNDDRLAARMALMGGPRGAALICKPGIGIGQHPEVLCDNDGEPVEYLPTPDPRPHPSVPWCTLGVNPDEISEAPWCDPANPLSQEILGMVLHDIRGLDTDVRQTTVTPAGLCGSEFGATRLDARTLVFDATIVLRDCCADEAAIRWLDSCITGNICGTGGCPGELRFLVCEPPADVEDWSPYVRRLRNVRNVSGVRVVNRFGRCCEGCKGLFLRVQWTMVAGDPHVYTVPECCLDRVPVGNDGCACDIDRFVLEMCALGDLEPPAEEFEVEEPCTASVGWEKASVKVFVGAEDACRLVECAESRGFGPDANGYLTGVPVGEFTWTPTTTGDATADAWLDYLQCTGTLDIVNVWNGTTLDALGVGGLDHLRVKILPSGVTAVGGEDGADQMPCDTTRVVAPPGVAQSSGSDSFSTGCGFAYSFDDNPLPLDLCSTDSGQLGYGEFLTNGNVSAALNEGALASCGLGVNIDVNGAAEDPFSALLSVDLVNVVSWKLCGKFVGDLSVWFTDEQCNPVADVNGATQIDLSASSPGCGPDEFCIEWTFPEATTGRFLLQLGVFERGTSLWCVTTECTGPTATLTVPASLPEVSAFVTDPVFDLFECYTSPLVPRELTVESPCVVCPPIARTRICCEIENLNRFGVVTPLVQIVNATGETINGVRVMVAPKHLNQPDGVGSPCDTDDVSVAYWRRVFDGDAVGFVAQEMPSGFQYDFDGEAGEATFTGPGIAGGRDFGQFVTALDGGPGWSIPTLGPCQSGYLVVEVPCVDGVDLSKLFVSSSHSVRSLAAVA